MSLPPHQELLLEQTEHTLNESAPDLAAMLAAFGALTQNVPMPAHERLPAQASGWHRMAAWLALLASWLGPVCGELLATAGPAWGACSCLDGGFPGHGRTEPELDR